MWQVAPYAGAWIEIKKAKQQRNSTEVAPYAGAWIEIKRMMFTREQT